MRLIELGSLLCVIIVPIVCTLCLLDMRGEEAAINKSMQYQSAVIDAQTEQLAAINTRLAAFTVCKEALKPAPKKKEKHK